MNTAKYWIDKLGMLKHPEGGHFKEIYRSEEIISKEALPNRFNGNRPISTSIYFLLERDEKSVFHRIKSDEIWHYYRGAPIELHIISEVGSYECKILGPEIEKEESLQIIINQGSWFAAKVVSSGDFSLVGCTVAPGFDFNDFEIADKSNLLEKYPDYSKVIEEFLV